MASSYTAVKRVYPEPTDPRASAFIESVLVRAITAPVTLGYFGDSQELIYGEGRAYCPRFAQRMAEYYGYVGATGWCAPGSSVQTTPFIRGAGGAAGSPTGSSTSDFPPGFEYPIKATNTQGLNYCLQPDMIGVASQAGATTEAQFAPPNDLIDTTNGDYWVCDILLATKGYTSEATFSTSMLWEVRKHTGSVPNASGTMVASNTESGLNLDIATKAIVTVTTTPFQLDSSNKYTTLNLYSSNANPILPIAIRFRNITKKGGIHTTWFSAGGYKSDSIASSHSGCSTVLAAMGLTAMAFGYGANDAYSGGGFTAAQFKANLQSLVTFVRAAAGKTLPVIACVDCWRREATAPMATQFDQFAGAYAEMADADQMFRVCNTRLVSEELGWTKSNEDIASLTGGAEWAVTTAYTTSNYVVVTGASPMWFKCISGHTSAAADKPMTGANWRTYWKRCVRFVRSDADLVHHSWEGGCLKADIDTGLILSANPAVPRIQRGPRGEVV
jgi:hypothetical protein